ncbi:uncharacterized protein LOC122853563 [Aphidius gifuensis]|uniref:uncharacterized protein LOC122853563 n=1 Tax=Aphidius gifuensis TaxID=684658 RepID=UPI001CDC12F7|nr:uncharacterized protein LOC122853563 [Aphidius gifuensis]
MKWFLFIVVLNLLHKYAYGEEITMFVDINDTVDIRVEKETKLGFLYSCKASQYSDNGVLIASYTLMELKNCQLNQKDQSVMKYFEFLDYDASCSFTISPFPKEFYGHWIVNTTSDIGEHQEAVYSYKYQEFYLTIPPKVLAYLFTLTKDNLFFKYIFLSNFHLQENISHSTDDHFEYKNDTGISKFIYHNKMKKFTIIIYIFVFYVYQKKILLTTFHVTMIIQLH